MTLTRYLIIALFGLPISIIDIRSRRIPNRILIGMGLTVLISYGFSLSHLPQALLTCGICALLLFPFSLIRGAGLGAGDIKLIVLLALILGRVPHIIAALILASIVGLLQIAVSVLIRRRSLQSIAFAPALILGALLSI